MAAILILSDAERAASLERVLGGHTLTIASLTHEAVAKIVNGAFDVVLAVPQAGLQAFLDDLHAQTIALPTVLIWTSQAPPTEEYAHVDGYVTTESAPSQITMALKIREHLMLWQIKPTLLNVKWQS